MLAKEKLIDKQRRLVDQRDQLKDKLKHINDGVKKGSLSSSSSLARKDSIDLPPKSLNPKKPLPSVLSHHSGNQPTFATVTETSEKLQSVSEEPPSEKASSTRPGNLPGKPVKKLSKETRTHPPVSSNQNDQQGSQTPPVRSPSSLSKYKKLSDIEPMKNAESPRKSKKIVKRKPGSPGRKSNKYFPAGFMADYCKQAGNTQFALPMKEYSDLMYLKTELGKRLKNNAIALDAGLKQLPSDDPPPEGNKMKRKCFSQITQTLENDANDGVVTNCYLNNKFLIIIQKNRINAYNKDGSLKKWILKDSMVRLPFENVINEMIVPCVLNKTETVVFCEVYLVKEPHADKYYLKMAQYRFFSEDGKGMKDFLLGSFDCDLDKFKSCLISRRACTVAVSAWAKQQSKSIAWIFTHAIVTDSIRCTPMIPVKHELVSLHDISVVATKTMLLGFGMKSFTVWNGKTGERFIFVNMSKLSPVTKFTCFYGVFAIIQKGFLFLVVQIRDKLHMIAVNMETALYKSLRQFKLPKDHICFDAVVREDKLIGITNKSIICWSLYNSFKLQQLKIEEGDKIFPMRKKLLVTSPDKFKRILYIKSVNEMQKQQSGSNQSYDSIKEEMNDIPEEDNEETKEKPKEDAVSSDE